MRTRRDTLQHEIAYHRNILVDEANEGRKMEVVRVLSRVSLSLSNGGISH